MQLLEEFRGQDISDVFEGGGSLGHAHSRGARALLERYRVGRLQGQQGEQRRDLNALVDESKPLLPQVGACGAAVPGGVLAPPPQVGAGGAAARVGCRWCRYRWALLPVLQVGAATEAGGHGGRRAVGSLSLASTAS